MKTVVRRASPSTSGRGCRRAALTRTAAKASLPGDNGFDPLNLGEIEANLIRAREAELIHGRYAMLGAAGCLAVELLGQGTWIDAPKWAVTGGVPEYLGVANPLLNLPAIALIQLVAMAYIELKRTAVDDVEKRLYPGGAFDPLGFAKDGGAKLTDLKEKEIAKDGGAK